MVSTATKADLHDLVDELSDEKVETAKRFLETLRESERGATNVIARFIRTMDPDEAALLGGLAELDRQLGEPAAATDEPDHPE